MSKRAPAVMSERQRAFRALKGEVYPRVGDVGRFYRNGLKDEYAESVEVTRVSASGATIWARFTSEDARRRLGSGPHRFGRQGNGLYWGSGGGRLYGDVWFVGGPP